MPFLEEIKLDDERIWDNTFYFVPFVLDLQELGDTGFYFRILFLNEERNYVFTVLSNLFLIMGFTEKLMDRGFWL